MKKRSALIAGASGLVGKHLLDRLRGSGAYDKIYVLSRRSLELNDPDIDELIIDFDELPTLPAFPKVQDVFCCLGTTMKQAGSKEAFRKVDYTYPLELARRAVREGAERYLLVSAMGAKKNSFIFYNRVKGAVEEDISKLGGFKSVSFFRPSLLLGDRREHRAGEGFAQGLFRYLKPLMIGPLRKYRAIHARTVANGMFTIARQEELRGVHIYESEEIKSIAGELALSHKE